jgi:uncharacterized protein
MKILLLILGLFMTGNILAQNKTYKDSIETYFKNYVKAHEVVKGKEKELMSFFPANEQYRINCHFERIMDAPWFPMETSGLIKKIYRVYGKIKFTINDTTVSLNIYQSQDLMATQQYRDHLFIPFTDATSGEETYIGGRYFDFEIKDIKDNKLVVDFNKAYNPYCAYVNGKYNCPIPPVENRLFVAIRAGEKAFVKSH